MFHHSCFLKEGNPCLKHCFSSQEGEGMTDLAQMWICHFWENIVNKIWTKYKNIEVLIEFYQHTQYNHFKHMLHIVALSTTVLLYSERLYRLLNWILNTQFRFKYNSTYSFI